MCLLIFLITELTASGFLTVLPISLLGICHQTAGVAINQPHGIHLITSVISMFWLRSLICHFWFRYLSPGPVSSPRYSPVKRTFGIPSHFPLGICHQTPGFRYTPSGLWLAFYNSRCIAPFGSIHLSVRYGLLPG